MITTQTPYKDAVLWDGERLMRMYVLVNSPQPSASSGKREVVEGATYQNTTATVHSLRGEEINGN